MVSDSGDGIFGSDRNTHLGYFGLTTAIFLCCLIVGFLAYVSGQQNERRDKTPASYSQAAEEDARRACVGMDRVATFECVYKKVQASQNQAHDEQDLDAQQRAAMAAIASAFIAFLALIATALGVYYVRRTLEATAEAVKETGKASNAMLRQNELTEHAQRPWVKISAELVNFELVERRVIIVDWSVKFENIGQMVAHNFQSLVKFIPMNEKFFTHMAAYMDDFPGDMEEIDAVLIPRDSSVYKGQSGNTIETLPWETKDGFRKDCVLMLIAMARYRIPGNDTWRFSMQGFAIAENLENIDDRHFRYDFPDSLSLKDMHIRKLGRSRAT